jgi:hypothetical protein
MNQKNFIILGVSIVILGLSVAYTGMKIADGLQNFRNYERFVTMKGLAQQDVVADLAIWPISYTETGNELTELQGKMEANGEKIVSFLHRHGLSDDEIELKQVRVQDLLAQGYRQNNTSRYILTQTYLVRTNNIDAINKASKDLGSLIKQNVVFSSSGSTAPTYLFTKLNALKPDMIAQATKNAKAGAAEFAEHSGQKVGRIKYASQGVFQILPRDQTYSLPEAQQINKTVRVVSTIQFYLED